MRLKNIPNWTSLLILLCWASISFAQEPIANRIAIRHVGEQAEFYDTMTLNRFIPRGTNYIDFQPTGYGAMEDRVFATNIYDPERIRKAFHTLAEQGYNTVRIFIDTCGDGPYCIGNPDGDGLNPDYLDNIVDTMYIAGEEGIYLLLTANSVPSQGGYWPYFDSIYYDKPNPFFEAGHINGAYMVEEGFEVHRRYWQDLMNGLIVERQAPTEVLLGWQLFNEHWFFGDKPPFTLTEGIISLPFGDYDLSSPEQRRQMGIDATLHMMNELVPIIRNHDPKTLITMGFFAPDFPNPASFGGSWDTDTAPLLDSAPLDFFDFHAYADSGVDIKLQAENFGIIGYTDKPIIMGETGIAKSSAYSAQSAASIQLRWNAESCAFGFQGWLQWAYYPWPDGIESAIWWGLMDEDGAMLEALSPHNQPDPCSPIQGAQQNIAYQSEVSYSNQIPEEPASLAVDGSNLHYCPNTHPPQWIQTNFDQAHSISQVAGIIASWPSGNRQVQIWATLQDKTQVLIAEYDEYMHDEQVLVYHLPGALEGVTAVRFLTLTGDVWPCWHEVEVLSASADTASVCIIKPAGNSVNLRSGPSTDTEVMASLNSGQAAIAISQTQGDDGFIWWQLTNNSWIRDDVATHSDNCTRLKAN